MAPLALAEWRAEQLRFTAFPILGATGRSTDWWEQSTGVPPEETILNERKRSSVVSGSFGAAKLALRLEPERIEWLLVPQDIDAEAIPAELEFPNVGPLIEALAVFSAVVVAWLALPDVPDLGRVAFGAVLRHDEPDRRSGYRRLPDYIPLNIEPDASDFLYQINHPIASRTGIEGMEINRLSKWSVSAFKLVGVTVPLASGAPQPIVTPAPVFALRLELDINTAPGFENQLPRNRFVDVYHELVSFGEQIVREGLTRR
jgi:hypothetical protein